MGGSSVPFNPKQISREIREEEKKALDKDFVVSLSNLLSEFLSEFNGRDVVLVNERLADIVSHLSDIIEGEIDQIFGGSVAKHTFVDGLSDVDCLLLLNNTAVKSDDPTAILENMTKILSDRLKGSAQVSHGELAITIKYKDGMELQLLPALKEGDGFKIASSRVHDRWSKINPKTFQEALTKRNAECDMKLVPTIKLAKAIIGQLPDAHQLAGYHIESLAISAFKGYSGVKTTSAMLPHFFEQASQKVLNPIKDSTGQSVHVDGYMGAAESQQRKNASHLLARIAKRMANASAASSMDQWKELFGE